MPNCVLTLPSTKVYTSVCYTTKKETTVYDNDETRTLSVYPTSRYTSVITTTVSSYPAHSTPVGYSAPPEKTSTPSSATYELEWDEYVSSAYECLKSEAPYASYSVPVGYPHASKSEYPEHPPASASPYPSKPDYPDIEQPSASPYPSNSELSKHTPALHAHSHASIPIYEKYGSSLPQQSPSVPTYPVPSAPAPSDSGSYPPTHASGASTPSYTKVSVTILSAKTEYPTTPANSMEPTSGTYTYGNATIAYGGNSTASTTGPVQFTGGAETHG
jgi:hypothetical protein